MFSVEAEVAPLPQDTVPVTDVTISLDKITTHHPSKAVLQVTPTISALLTFEEYIYTLED
eukprot:10716422-Ditylum_brightwellii.AAC.1